MAKPRQRGNPSNKGIIPTTTPLPPRSSSRRNLNLPLDGNRDDKTNESSQEETKIIDEKEIEDKKKAEEDNPDTLSKKESEDGLEDKKKEEKDDPVPTDKKEIEVEVHVEEEKEEIKDDLVQKRR